MGVSGWGRNGYTVDFHANGDITMSFDRSKLPDIERFAAQHNLVTTLVDDEDDWLTVFLTAKPKETNPNDN